MKDQRGFTLVEMMAAAGILVLVFTTTATILLTAQRSSQYVLQNGDLTQQLRVAMKQIADDMTYAEWDEFHNPPPGGLVTVTEFTIIGRMPVVTQERNTSSGPDWSYSDWPGYIYAWSPVYIRYALVGDTLVREVKDENGFPVSKQILISGLAAAGSGEASFLEIDSSQRTVNVRLSAPQAGGNRYAKLFSSFYLRPVM